MLQLIMSTMTQTVEDIKLEPLEVEVKNYHCPDCLSMMIDITVDSLDGVVDRELDDTGDVASFVCLDCGRKGDVEGDLIYV
jgi:uncharacterized protein with PIN domain